jgi:nicotinamidase-related amidase
MGTLLSPPGAYAANLCIDMQNLFAPGGPWATPWMERVAPFVAALTQKHVNTLVVSGGETDVCVLATVLAAVDRGYRVILAQDALCSSSDHST